MTRITTLCSFIILLLTACNSTSKESGNLTKSDKDINIKLDEYFQTLTTLEKFNGVALVERSGDRILFKEYNMSGNVESTLNIHKLSQFDIHSISKLMAKAAVLDLEKESLISSSDKISDYIPGFPEGDRISIQHLLDNQSGLPRGFTHEIPNLCLLYTSPSPRD